MIDGNEKGMVERVLTSIQAERSPINRINSTTRGHSKLVRFSVGLNANH